MYTDELVNQVYRYVERISDRTIRRKVRRVLESIGVKLYGYYPLSLSDSPAGEKIHHEYRGGLLEHTIASIEIALALSDLIENRYKGRVDRDTVISALILHDLYKVYCYERSGEGFRRSDLGLLLDHHTLIVAELIRRGFPTKIVHAVLAAHGRYGPSTPKTVEALIVHLADYMDSTLASELTKGAQLAMERMGVKPPETITVTDALKILEELGRSG
ncbi:MAG: HD domain-containing protein [Nitrososphaerota archaeon]|nr:HD domain-containing protein [Candidatus Bathyarchaeota archaeon]MDW8062124.1 HD domain-containing protein [Nitrososphaerota archaeon]